MKRFLFFGIGISFLVLLCSPTGYSSNSHVIKKSIQTTDKIYFTELKESFKEGSSYEKSHCSYMPIQNNYSPQIDTTKKKIKQPNEGLGQIVTQNIIPTEIDGLLLDATFSPGGYDFYIDFSQNWTAPATATNYKIVVKEYPGRGANIIVAIEVNDKQLVYRRMRPIYPTIHALSIAATNYLNGYIARGDHLRGVDADGNFIDVQQNNTTKQIKTPFDIY